MFAQQIVRESKIPCILADPRMQIPGFCCAKFLHVKPLSWLVIGRITGTFPVILTFRIISVISLILRNITAPRVITQIITVNKFYGIQRTY